MRFIEALLSRKKIHALLFYAALSITLMAPSALVFADDDIRAMMAEINEKKQDMKAALDKINVKLKKIKALDAQIESEYGKIKKLNEKIAGFNDYCGGAYEEPEYSRVVATCSELSIESDGLEKEFNRLRAERSSLIKEARRLKQQHESAEHRIRMVLLRLKTNEKFREAAPTCGPLGSAKAQAHCFLQFWDRVSVPEITRPETYDDDAWEVNPSLKIY